MPCDDSTMHVIGSAEYFNRLALIRDPDQDFPVCGTIELTLACNMRCRHCYARFTGSSRGEMELDDIRSLLDKLADSGVLFLAMTGGEIMARKDFTDIYLHAKARGFLLSLLTNATLVDEPMADLLAEWRPRSIEITVYGHTRATYESVTGTKGSFNRFRRGVSLLTERNLPLHFKMMVLRSNVHEFDRVRGWAQKQGISFRHDEMVNPGLDGNSTPLQERLPAAETARLMGVGEKEKADWHRVRESAHKKPHDGHIFRCGAGIGAFHVDPSGNMHPCTMWRHDPFDPMSGPLNGRWQSHVRTIRKAKAPAGSRCLTCMDLQTCGNCPAVSRLETGTAGREVDYCCAVAREREKLMNTSCR